jgi:hypothetical protein
VSPLCLYVSLITLRRATVVVGLDKWAELQWAVMCDAVGQVMLWHGFPLARFFLPLNGMVDRAEPQSTMRSFPVCSDICWPCLCLMCVYSVLQR